MLSNTDIQEILQALDLDQMNAGSSDGTDWIGHGKRLSVTSPVNDTVIAEVILAGKQDYEQVVNAAEQAFYSWRSTPSPKRGEIIRQLGQELRLSKNKLARLITLEMGKSIQESLGEVQEMIDICDFACGLSRQLYGVQTHSERPYHRMFEQWHPLGIVGVITAFNFPTAVWAWNLTIALICGNVVVWKPASKTPLTAIVCQNIFGRVLKKNELNPAISTLVTGSGSEIGELLNNDPRINLVSYTGSTETGKHIAKTVASRLGKTILELGGNNGVIVTPKANLDLAAENIFFGAIGTAGQRCTTTRRIIIEQGLSQAMLDKLLTYYQNLRIGNPFDDNNLMGPVVSGQTVEIMMQALSSIEEQGGHILYGGKQLSGDDYPGSCYVTPAIVKAPVHLPLIQKETFVPILYVLEYQDSLQEAINIHNNVPQGLSSAIFTNDLLEAETFLSALGSDCGIANVNLGTSGAEIGLAFGGEKETGGGRESGSDAWKSYMRRQSNTVNWSGSTMLAQGIQFEQ